MSARRLFVAIWPPVEVVESISLLPRKSRPGLRFVDPSNWHITLRFLGAVDAEAAVTALDRCRLPATTVHLGPLVELLGDHSLILRVDGADEMAQSVAAATLDLGEPPRRRFVGHLTLARLSRATPRNRVALLGAPFRIGFAVESVSLVESLLRPDGARYTTLATWPCGGPESAAGEAGEPGQANVNPARPR